MSKAVIATIWAFGFLFLLATGMWALLGLIALVILLVKGLRA